MRQIPTLLTAASLSAAFCAAFLQSAAAAVDRSKKPAPGPAPAASFPEFNDVTMPNGLRIFIIEDDRRPTVTFRLMVKSGSIFDGKKPGTASLTATLLNRGTVSRDAAAFATQTDFIGSRVEASASPDSISITASSLNKYTEKLLDLITDAIRNPVFAEEQLSKTRKQTLSKLEAQKQQPEALSAKLAARLVYGSHPYGNVATPESINAIQRDDLVAFHKTHFHPNNATLAVVGDVSAKEILPLVEKAFGNWEKSVIPQQPAPEFAKIEGRSIHIIDRAGSVQSNIVVTHPGAARNTPDLPEVLVLNATLGGGFSGRLFQNLRETHGWTYGAYSAFDLKKHGGAFEASAETRNEVTAPAAAEILKEIERIRKDPVPEEELALQREYNVGNYLLSLEKSDRTAQRVQDIDLYGLPSDFYRNYARRMSSVTPELLQKTANRHLHPEDALIIVVGEAKEIRAALEPLGKVTVYNTDLNPVP
jgi:predicted Zn-dependent peptidase